MMLDHAKRGRVMPNPAVYLLVNGMQLAVLDEEAGGDAEPGRWTEVLKHA
jgi:hypothetical protein